MSTTVRYTFSMDAIQDAHLVKRLEQEINMSAVVREAIRAYYEQPDHRQLDAKLDLILDALRGVQVFQPDTDEGGEPARARANLDKLIDRFSQD